MTRDATHAGDPGATGRASASARLIAAEAGGKAGGENFPVALRFLPARHRRHLAAVYGFALSVDDYIVTKYTAGSEITFPLYVYGAVQRSVPTQIDVIGSMMMLVTMTGIAVMLLLGRLKTRKR